MNFKTGNFVERYFIEKSAIFSFQCYYNNYILNEIF